MQEIIDDLEKRELKLVSIIAEYKDGDLLLISYNKNGLVKFITEPVGSMTINERLDGGMVRPIAEIGRKDT